MDRKTKGIQGEAIAKQHYENSGYEILEANYRFERAEIDLIAIKEEQLLVFIEVKLRTRNDFGPPESFVSEAQQSRIMSAAEAYILAINWKKDIRFDIVAIGSEGNVEVFEDAF